MILSTVILILVPVALDMGLNQDDQDSNELPENYWLYNGTIMAFNFTFYVLN